MSIRDQEDKIFSLWRTKRPRLVSDGVVDEAAYLRSDRKILFVLKEVNDQNGGWDLRGWLKKEGGQARTWNNIARWVLGIRSLGTQLEWKQIAKIGKADRIELLASIAAVNLKKTPGGHTANSDEIAAVATEDQDLLLEQIAMYDADLIICCGTAQAFNANVRLSDSRAWQSTKRDVWYYEYKPGKFVIDYLHPEVRCAAALVYYGLIDAIEEILSSSSSMAGR